VKVITWNVNGRPPRATWEYIDRFLGADIAFVQEAVAVTGPGFGPGQWLWEEIGANSKYKDRGRYQWATGIRARSGGLAPMDTSPLGPGWVVGATCELAGQPITLINVHIELFPDRCRLATATLNHTIDALAEHLGSPNVIFGGDLNVDRLMDGIHGGHRNAKVLDRLENLGLFDVNRLLPQKTRTFRGSDRPYQDDRLFVSESLKELIDDVRVIMGTRTAALSDHYPVVLELRL
jgi:hypothetical protein